MEKSIKKFKTLFFLTVFLSVSFLHSPVFAQTERGVDLFNYWDFNKAEDAFREALKNNPLLRGGVPEKEEQPTTFKGYRDEEF